MPRKPVETVQVNLRIKESLRRQLERKAREHQISLNKEMTYRLEQSFEDREAKLRFWDLSEDMEVNWSRFAERLLKLSLEEDLAKALAKTKDPEVSKLASAWLGIGRGEKK